MRRKYYLLRKMPWPMPLSFAAYVKTFKPFKLLRQVRQPRGHPLSFTPMRQPMPGHSHRRRGHPRLHQHQRPMQIRLALRRQLLRRQLRRHKMRGNLRPLRPKVWYWTVWRLLQ